MRIPALLCFAAFLAPAAAFPQGRCEVRTVWFAQGPQAGQPVTSRSPAHVGDTVSALYSCVHSLDGPPPLHPAASPRTVTATVGDAATPLVGDALGRLTLVIPAPQTGSSRPDTTIRLTALQLQIAGMETLPHFLPVVYEPNGSSLGSPDAPVTVVEYGDYQCPFCGSFFQNTWPRLKAEYVDTGKVRFLFQDMAFLGSDSVTAAEAAHCAGDQYRFWEFHDYLYTHQGGENSGWAAAGQLKNFAAALGLAAAPFNSCLDGGKYAQEVKNETSQGSQQKISGTPGFLIDGTLLIGAQPVSVFEQAIDAALERGGA